MNNRLSYASSPESDGEMRPNSMYEDDDDDEPSPIPKRKMIRSSSDPSINTQENIPGIPPYPAPPNYHRDRQVSNSHIPGTRKWLTFQPPLQFGFSH